METEFNHVASDSINHVYVLILMKTLDPVIQWSIWLENTQMWWEGDVP